MFAHIAQAAAAGVGDAVWTAVWQWGLGVFLIIVCGVGAMFSPIGKQSFIIAGAGVAIALFIFARGQIVEHNICDAKIKYIYLKAHPKLNKTNLSPGWTVSPKWMINSPVTYSSDVKPPCGPMEWGCQ